MAFAVLAEDDAGDGGDLRAFEQDVGGGAAVGVDARHVGEGVEGPGGRGRTRDPISLRPETSRSRRSR